MSALAFNQAYIDKANEALSLALSRGLNTVAKPSIDVQVLLDAIGTISARRAR